MGGHEFWLLLTFIRVSDGEAVRRHRNRHWQLARWRQWKVIGNVPPGRLVFASHALGGLVGNPNAVVDGNIAVYEIP